MNPPEMNSNGKSVKELTHEEKVAKIAEATKTILEVIGEDPNREGLLKTPKRMAEAMLYFTKGYAKEVEGKSSDLYCKIPHRCYE